MNPNNPPAFPCKEERIVQDSTGADSAKFIINHEGMSLRDWFAGQALQRLIPKEGWTETGVSICAPAAAKQSYIIADAMLTARNGGGE